MGYQNVFPHEKNNKRKKRKKKKEKRKAHQLPEVLERRRYLIVRLIALEVELQHRKENTLCSAQLSNFALDCPTALRSITPKVHSIAHYRMELEILETK
jgi:hypothetical protein